jgi:hypothetical protein
MIRPRRRKKRRLAHVRRLLHGGDQQAPDGRRHHHPGGKAGERPLEHGPQAASHKEHAPRAENRSQEGEQNPLYHFNAHDQPPPAFV